MEQSAQLQDPADKAEEELPTLHTVAIHGRPRPGRLR